MSETKLRDEIATWGRSLFERGLTAGSTGNISVRLDDGSYLVTPTKACLGRLEPGTLSRLDAEGRWLEGDKPTKETFLHLAMYHARRSATAIVHLHSTHSVAVSCLPEVDGEDCLPPLTAYYVMRVGRLKLLPYYMPGDPALGNAISGVAGKHSAVLLANHGPVVAGKSLDSAVYAVEELEETAKLYMLLRGTNPRTLTAEQVAELEAHYPRG